MKSRKKSVSSGKNSTEEKNSVIDKKKIQEERESLLYFIYLVKNIIKTNMLNSNNMKKNEIFSVNDYNIYNQELETLKKAYPNVQVEVLEEQAANIVRNTLPNYDRVPKGVKGLRELPLGSFFSFPAEIIRTSYHIVKQSGTEVLSSNATMRARGAKRIAGFTVTTVGFDQLASYTGNLAGINEQEQDGE